MNRKFLVAAAVVALGAATTIGAGVTSADYIGGQAAMERGDTIRALEEFRRAAEAGDARAQFRLGEFYERGDNVLQDFVIAHMWYNLAATGGHAEAAGKRESLAERMTAEQMARAQDLARQRVAMAEPAARTPAPQPGAAAPGPQVITTADVEMVQRRLNALGYQAGPADGVVGPRTRTALRDWQQDVNLPATGLIDRQVVERLATATAAREPARVAAPQVQPQPQAAAPALTRAEQIRQVQSALARAGHDPGPIDGAMGPRTRAAIQDWQRSQGMPVTGEITPSLLAGLGVDGRVAAAPPRAPTADRPVAAQRRGGEAELATAGRLEPYTTAVQEQLADHGYFQGAVTGQLTDRLRSAIREYERDAGLPVTGQVSEDLLDHLKFARPEVIKQQRAGAR